MVLLYSEASYRSREGFYILGGVPPPSLEKLPLGNLWQTSSLIFSSAPLILYRNITDFTFFLCFLYVLCTYILSKTKQVKILIFSYIDLKNLRAQQAKMTAITLLAAVAAASHQLLPSSSARSASLRCQ